MPRRKRVPCRCFFEVGRRLSLNDFEQEVQRIHGTARGDPGKVVEAQVKSPMDKVISVCLSPETWDELQREAHERGVGPASLAEMCILERLRQMRLELDLKPMAYEDLNSRQRENYNFQKISAVLADFGFKTMRLSDDWEGADFIAYHNDGERFLKVQLKGRLWVDTKYKGKDIWICFRHKGTWYVYPHDAALRWALDNKNISQTKGWKHCSDWEKVAGAYSWPHPPEDFLRWLEKYALRQ